MRMSLPDRIDELRAVTSECENPIGHIGEACIVLKSIRDPSAKAFFVVFLFFG
jgi:hypothetical protein